jgi:fluoroacetyl-CoA thioesterase
MKPVAPGTRLHRTLVPPAADTAAALGNTGVEVISTPAIIGYLEMTSHLLIQPLFEQGEASVGTEVSIRHLAAAFPGIEMACEAEVETVRGRRIRLKVRASQAGKVIMDGHHERAVVDLARFMTRG